MKNKYFYPIFKLKAKSWIRYWLLKKTEFKGKLSEILEGTSFYLENSLDKKFNKFDIVGRKEQESTTGKNKIDYTKAKPGGTTPVILIENGFNAKGLFAGQIVVEGLKKNTNYYLSCNRQTISGDTKTIIIYAGTTQTSTVKNLTGNGTFNTGNNTTVNIWFYVGDGTNSGEANFTNIQLEEGTVATDYEPYTGGTASPNPSYPQTIYNTGDEGFINEKVSNSDGTQEQEINFPLASGQNFYEGDYLADDGVHHVESEVVLDGTEAWGKQWGANSHLFYTSKIKNNTKRYSSATSNIICKSNKYIATHYDGGTGSIYQLIGDDNYPYLIAINDNLSSSNVGNLIIKDNRFITIEDWKAYLAEQYANGTPVKVQYKLEQEVIDAYTEQQQAVYDQIKALRTYKGGTHIDSSNNVKPYLKIQYWESDTNG